MRCRICGAEGKHPACTVREMMFGLRDEFEYFQCVECGCLQIRNFPEDMSKYYPEGYYSFSSKPTDRIENPVRRALYRARNRHLLFGGGAVGKMVARRFPMKGPHFESYKILSRIPLSRDSRILDIGCGNGAHIRSLQYEVGFRHIAGADPGIKKDLEYEGGVRVFRRNIGGMEGEWDLIMFHHSLEHIPEQHETMESAARRLAPGGVCLIRIPVVSSLAWERYGVHWADLDAPRHLFLHSLKSLRLLAGKAGLEVFDVVYDSTAFQFWASEQYSRDIPLNAPNSYLTDPAKSPFSRDQIEEYDRMARKLNGEGRGDQAAFYLRASKNI